MSSLLAPICLAQTAAPQTRETLTIAAAADLSPLADVFRENFPQAELKFSFGGSGALARQIEAGAPFDLYLSASEDFVNQLVKKGKILKESVQVYAIGRLALWSADGKVKQLQDLVRPEIRAVALANPKLAPYGEAAEAALRNAGLWNQVQPKIVVGENIRQAYQFVETKNADAGIVAWSLVYNQNGILIPDDLHPPIRQVGGPVRRRGAKTKLAEEFMAFLMSDKGRSIFATRGFNLLPGAPTLRRN